MTGDAKSDALKLLALDAEDLAVVSAQLQDAVVRVGDLAYVKSAQRFASVLNRFNWMAALQSGETETRGPEAFERRQCALRFERVRAAKLQNIDLADKRRVLSLLAIQFEPTHADQPDGEILLIFAGGAAIKLDVECIECELRDLGAAWSTKSMPAHPGEGVEFD